MAQTTANILLGGATVDLSVYVAAGGAGTFVEAGHTEGPTEISMSQSDYEVKSQQTPGVLKRVGIETMYALKFTMLETTLENWRQALRQAVANLTGTPPNLTLRVQEAKEQYHQIRLVGKGVGTTGARTVTIWKGIISEVEALPFDKENPQKVGVTLACLYDETVATADKFLKVVDA